MIAKETTVNSDLIYTGKTIQLRVDTVEVPNKGYQKREIIEHKGSVAIVAITNDNKIVLVKQYRKSIEKELYELPSGKIEIGESPLDCAIRELKEETGYSTENLKLIYKVEKNLMIKADREKIIRALNNIINNAIKYSPENEKIIIKSFKSKASKTVVLEVENTGVTIENKYLNEVFDPFFRVEKSRNRKTGGSGLGLYIVSKILKSHNLYYKIESKRNSVLFTIYF